MLTACARRDWRDHTNHATGHDEVDADFDVDSDVDVDVAVA